LSPHLWHLRPCPIPSSCLLISASTSSSHLLIFGVCVLISSPHLWRLCPHRPLPAIATPQPSHAVGAGDTLGPVCISGILVLVVPYLSIYQMEYGPSAIQ
jgi:hypothetical protein